MDPTLVYTITEHRFNTKIRFMCDGCYTYCGVGTDMYCVICEGDFGIKYYTCCEYCIGQYTTVYANMYMKVQYTWEYESEIFSWKIIHMHINCCFSIEDRTRAINMLFKHKL